MKAREAADARRVLMRMKDRFSKDFNHDESSISWYNWTTERNLDEIERDALSASLRILSIIAAIRFDEMPDQIENVLYSSLMDRTVPDPSLPNTFMGATLDTPASDTWEEVSPKATTLLKPEDCKSLWLWVNFIEEIEPMVTGARSLQDGRRRNRSYAAGAGAAAAAGVGAVVAGPAAVVNAGIVIFTRAMRL
uniref:Sey1/RHD3-like three-helix bundle domain-containing protein n=1 Tax=Populus trichocarpa TaxID=3694 RepID=A0A3N7FMK6_POPTR|eukprot:XP_006376978.1 protein ROOT HAIR DEFECTIVE 3 homolog 2 [Populus trichocarpa]